MESGKTIKNFVAFNSVSGVFLIVISAAEIVDH